MSTTSTTRTDVVSLHREQAAELAMLTEHLHRWLLDASSTTRAELAAFLGGAGQGALAVARLRRRLPEAVAR